MLTATSERQRFASLDGWRGICACLVALYHFPVFSNLYELPLIRNAYLFVDFFFVLSGFVIAASYSHRLSDGKALRLFMLRRVGRLYPLHLFVLVLWIGLELSKWLASTNGWITFTNSAFTGATNLEALWLNLLMLHSMGFSDNLSWNYPSWSISSELLAYLCFGLCTWWLRKPWLIYAGVVLIAPWLIYQLDGDMFVTYDYGYIRCFLGFCCGVFVYKLYLRLESSLSKKASAPSWSNLIEVSVIGLVCVFVSWVDQTPASILAPLIFAPVVLVFAFEAGALSRGLRAKPLLLIGALSYSIYMIHALVQELFKLVFLGALPRLTDQPWAFATEDGWLIGATTTQGNLLHISMLAMVIALSYLTYRYIELPGQDKVNGWTGQRLNWTNPAQRYQQP